MMSPQRWPVDNIKMYKCRNDLTVEYQVGPPDERRCREINCVLWGDFVRTTDNDQYLHERNKVLVSDVLNEPG